MSHHEWQHLGLYVAQKSSNTTTHDRFLHECGHTKIIEHNLIKVNYTTPQPLTIQQLFKNNQFMSTYVCVVYLGQIACVLFFVMCVLWSQILYPLALNSKTLFEAIVDGNDQATSASVYNKWLLGLYSDEVRGFFKGVIWSSCVSIHGVRHSCLQRAT